MRSPSISYRPCSVEPRPQNPLSRIGRPVHFAGLSARLREHSESLIKKAEAERLQALYPKQIEALTSVAVKMEGQSLTGYQLLELVDELAQSNRWGVGSNLKRLAALGFGAACIGSVGIIPLLLCLSKDEWSDPPIGGIWQKCLNAFSNGASYSQIEKIFKSESNPVKAVLFNLADLELLEQVYNWRGDYYCWYLSPRGKELLSLGRTQGLTSVSAPQKAANAATPAKPILVEGTRGQWVQSFLDNLGTHTATGWDLLIACDKRSWFRPGVSQKKLGQQLQMESGSSAVLQERLSQLQKLGLVEKSKNSSNAEEIRWVTTEAGRSLVQKGTVEKALALTPQDLQEFIQSGLNTLAQTKQEKLNTLDKLEKVSQKAASNLAVLQKELETAEQKVLALNTKIQQETNVLAQEKLHLQFSDQLLEVKLLEDKISFGNRDKVTKEGLRTAYKSYLNQWLQQIHEAILQRNRMLLQLNEQQSDQSLQEILKEIKVLSDVKTENLSQEQLQLVDLVAALKKPSVEDPADVQAMLAATEAVNKVQQTQAVESVQQRVQLPPQKAMATNRDS